MNFFKKFNKNYKSFCTKYENIMSNEKFIFCKKEMDDVFYKTLNLNYSELKDFKPSEIELTVYKILFNLAFDMAVSGKYHIYRGVLNLTGESLRQLTIFCINTFYKMEQITENEYKEQIKLLSESIQEMG